MPPTARCASAWASGGHSRPCIRNRLGFENYIARFRVTETRRCPACGQNALQRQPDVVRTGNPLSPASDVDLDSHVLCLACGHMLTE